MRHMIFTLIFSLTFCNVAWAQFGEGTDGQTDLIVRPSQPQPKKQTPVRKTETEAQRRARLDAAERQRAQRAEQERLEELMKGNFQTFTYQAQQAGYSNIRYSDIIDFNSLIGFVSDSPLVSASATKFTELSGSVMWFYQDKVRTVDGVERSITVKSFGIDFIRPEWAIRFKEVTDDVKVSLFFVEPAELGALVPMHQVIVTKPEEEKIYFLPSDMANISESYKEAGMPYAVNKKIVDAFYAHIVDLSEKFNDTGICSIFYESEYVINKGIEEQDEGIRKIGKTFPETYNIFSSASDHIHNDDYFYINDTGVILSRVNQECNLPTLWNEYFYYIFIHGIRKPGSIPNTQ